jgi:hypothetical protein
MHRPGKDPATGEVRLGLLGGEIAPGILRWRVPAQLASLPIGLLRIAILVSFPLVISLSLLGDMGICRYTQLPPDWCTLDRSNGSPIK